MSIKIKQTFEFPVTNTDRKLFTQDIAQEMPKIKTGLFSFVFQSLQQLNLSQLAKDLNPRLPFVLQELFKNACDAYANKGLKSGEKLQISLGVSKENDQVVLKFKDNGTGFKDLPKSKKEPLTQTHALELKAGDTSIAQFGQSEKAALKDDECLGGRGIGLGRSIDELEILNKKVALFVKNRKLGGASIDIVFPLSS